MSQHRVLNNFANEFSSSASYAVGDFVLYYGILYKCISAHSPGSFNTNDFALTNFKGASSEVKGNPSDLTGNEPEIMGIGINGVNYQTRKDYASDGVTFKFTENADYTFENNYSSYNRIGKLVSFVVSCKVTKNAAVTAPITLGKFSNVPNEVTDKLVGGAFLLEKNSIAYEDGTFNRVRTNVSWTEGNDNSVSVAFSTDNLTQGTTYALRAIVVFLLTDNLMYAADPILDNNSWAKINRIAKAGYSASNWSIGDTKTDLGVDGVTRTFRIVEIEQDGSIVFEEVELENATQWNPSTNTDSDNAYNDYYISDVRNTVLPATLLKCSNDLQGVITTTNVKVATNGNNGTLLTLTDKLFLEAEKEIWAHRSYARTEEFNALSTFTYWITHNATNADHIKYQNGSAYGWWLRSPCSDVTHYACRTGYDGGSDFYDANSTCQFAPCFRIGTAQTGGLGPYVAISSVLENNSWDVIRQVAEAGDASNYWSVGDTKTDVGQDGNTRTFRIVDMSGLYGKHIVFEQVELEGTSGVAWDANGANDYSTSDMNTTVLPSVAARYSSGLQSALTNTTVKVAENGNAGSVISVTNKLFLEAEKEIYTRQNRSSFGEFNSLTTFSYWSTHSSNNDHIKKNFNSSAQLWVLRSPRESTTNMVCSANAYGQSGSENSNVNSFFAPCFSF